MHECNGKLMSMLKQNTHKNYEWTKQQKKFILSTYKWSESIADEYFCMQTVKMKISIHSLQLISRLHFSSNKLHETWEGSSGFANNVYRHICIECVDIMS